MTRTGNILSQKFFEVFLKTIFIHVSCYPVHYYPKIFFWFFKVRTHPSIPNFGLEASPGNAISEGRPILCNTSSEAGALDTGGTYWEWVGPKIFQVTIFRSFSENHFSPRFMLPCSLLAENIFLVFQSLHPTLASIQNFGLKASPGNAISEGRPPLCNTSLEAGALDMGGSYREWVGPKIF